MDAMQKIARGGKAATLADVAHMLSLLRTRGPGRQVELSSVFRKFTNQLFHGDYRFPDFTLSALARMPEGGGSRGLIYSTPNGVRALAYAIMKTPKVKKGFGLLTTVSGNKIPVLEHLNGSPLIPAHTLSRRGKTYIVSTKASPGEIQTTVARDPGSLTTKHVIHATDASLLVNLHKLRTVRPEFRRYIDPYLRRFDAAALDAERNADIERGWRSLFSDKMAEAVHCDGYERPYTRSQMLANGHGPALVDRLMRDPVHSWRAKTGIDMVHREPDLKEFLRTWVNWNRMAVADKARSDRKSIKLFGVDNRTNFKRLRPLYGSAPADSMV